MKTQHQKVLKLIQENKAGFTADFSFRKVNHKIGFYVAITNNANENPIKAISKLFEEKKKHKEIKLFGGWIDNETGLYYLDLSKHETDKQEALNIARQYNQKAILDIKQKCSINVI